MVRWKREPFRGPAARGPVGAAVGLLFDPVSFDSPLAPLGFDSPLAPLGFESPAAPAIEAASTYGLPSESSTQ